MRKDTYHKSIVDAYNYSMKPFLVKVNRMWMRFMNKPREEQKHASSCCVVVRGRLILPKPINRTGPNQKIGLQSGDGGDRAPK